MKKSLGLLMAGLMLVGCARLSDLDEGFLKSKDEDTSQEQTQEEKKVTMKCSNEDQGSLTFEAKGDQIEKMTQTFSMSFEELGIREDLDATTIQDKINQSLDTMYQHLDGVQVSGQMQDDQVEITITVDYTVADQDQLIEAGLLQSGEIDSTYVSLEQTQESYEDSGYTCAIE